MRTAKRGFTLIELLVVIAIIALLMAILTPTLHRVRKQARSVACLSNLRQWGYIWHMYTEDSDGHFNTGQSTGGPAANDWLVLLMPYYRERGQLTLCPSARLPMVSPGRFAFRAWSWDRQGWGNLREKETPDTGSYGQNEWICDREGDDYWRNRNRIARPDTVPLFFDCGYVDAWPRHTAGPPAYEGDTTGYNEWAVLCMNRHAGTVNYLFADTSTRRVGLKELWTLKWHRSFDTANAWTSAGAVEPTDWPAWMSGFRDY
jgi:prepilin-type N-terminal cleavage/methylation domain-containing protein/prepilin-type processing-associated H-X9-DG protein